MSEDEDRKKSIAKLANKVARQVDGAPIGHSLMAIVQVLFLLLMQIQGKGLREKAYAELRKRLNKAMRDIGDMEMEMGTAKKTRTK